jgi:hypothetical protein
MRESHRPLHIGHQAKNAVLTAECPNAAGDDLRGLTGREPLRIGEGLLTSAVPSTWGNNAGIRMRRIQIKSPKASHDLQEIAHPSALDSERNYFID